MNIITTDSETKKDILNKQMNIDEPWESNDYATKHNFDLLTEQ